MNQPGDKPSLKQRLIARAMATDKTGKAPASSKYQLIAACVLLALGTFCAWQSWRIMAHPQSAEQIHKVTRRETQALADFVANARDRVEKALNSRAVFYLLTRPGDDAENRAAAAHTARNSLPEAIDIELYSADLNEVLGSDFAKFGYTKAALLVQAHQSDRATPLQTQLAANKTRQLVMALPIHQDKQTLAYAYVELPYSPLQDLFRQASISGARIDLRQSDGQGDILLNSIGDTRTKDSLEFAGSPVKGSLFRISSRANQFETVLPNNLWLALFATLILVASGVVLLVTHKSGLMVVLKSMAWKPGKDLPDQATLAQTLAKSAPQKAPVAAPPAKPVPKPPPKPATKIPIDRGIFRAYDIRGVLGKTLSAEVAHQIGRAIGSEAQDRGLREIVVARDGRLSGPELAAALIEGLRSAGCDVIDIGAAPTPVLYFATYQLNTGSGVVVTGSHNPPDYNGFKIMLGGETLSEGAIQELYARITENRLSEGNGGLQTMDMSRDYIDRIAGDVMIERKLKVVVDCGNGIAGGIAPTVLEEIGCEVQPLYCEVDGKFPNHHPDPSDEHNLKDLILTVKQMKADIGLAFDGDGDRLGVVTADGEVIYPDRLLMLFAKDVLTRNPGAAIIYDVKCTGKLQSLILQAGGSPIMWKTGHSLIKAKMRETDAELAGEMSGHFFFRERWYGFDDGIYAAARLVEILAADPAGRSAQEIFSSLPKDVSTPELKIPIKEGENHRFVEKFREKAQFEGARVTTIDGVRADWPDGWGLVRASNTTPVLVLRFEADTGLALLRIQNAFRDQLHAINPQLKLPF